MLRTFSKYILHNVFCPVVLFLMEGFIQGIIRHKRLIIMYHGVRKEEQRINGRHISAVQFERQLRYFIRHFDVVPLNDICEMKLRRVVPIRKTISITFDDGYLNNLTVALPLLEKYGLPATFFLSTAAFENADYTHPADRIDLIRASTGSAEIAFSEHAPIDSRNFIGRNHAERYGYHYLHALSVRPLNRLLDKLNREFPLKDLTRNVNQELYALMDKASVEDMAARKLADIGSHGYHHVNLSALSDGEIDDELSLSRMILAKLSGRPVQSVAFPYGCFDDRVLASARKAGFDYLIAAGDVQSRDENRVFPRIGVLDGASFSYAMLSVLFGFRKFGF